MLSSLSVSWCPVDRLRHWCSSRYLRIPPLHREFHLPLHYSRKTVLKAIHGLSPWFSLPTCLPACAPFTPSNSGQRLHPTFYRPSIPLSFNLAVVLPRWITYCVNCGTEGVNPPTPSNHRLRHGLPGYLILFATHAFEPQRQLVPSRSPSPLVFLPISTHSTATPGIPPTSALLKASSFESNLWVEPIVFTSNLPVRLRSLYTQ